MLPPHRRAVSTGFAIGLDVLRVASIQAFALCCGLVAAIERSSREELERVHAELAAAQVALAAQERAAERSRIQRELHDGLGHHLAALGLTLELVRHRRDDPAPVDDARVLVKRMLGDVRAIVRHDTASEPIAIRDVLAALVSAIPTVETRLTIDDDAAAPRPDVAHAILRVTQEATTNAIRHGGARTIGIAVTRESNATVLTIADDGVGIRGTSGGTGIPGMQARVESAGGELRITAEADHGTVVRARFPDP